MIEGSCHCGQLRWRYAASPDHGTVCDCTLCRRYGAIWAYDTRGDVSQVTGPSQVYSRGDHEIGFHFCPTCGCLAYWSRLKPRPDGSMRAVNLRLAEPDAVAAIPIRRFDGLDRFEPRPRDGRCVADFWA